MAQVGTRAKRSGDGDQAHSSPGVTAAPSGPAGEALTLLSPSGARGSVIQDPNLEPEVLTVTGSLMPVSLPQAGRQYTARRSDSLGPSPTTHCGGRGSLCPPGSGCQLLLPLFFPAPKSREAAPAPNRAAEARVDGEREEQRPPHRLPPSVPKGLGLEGPEQDTGVTSLARTRIFSCGQWARQQLEPLSLWEREYPKPQVSGPRRVPRRLFGKNPQLHARDPLELDEGKVPLLPWRACEHLPQGEKVLPPGGSPEAGDRGLRR